jgi:hypothetical protein
MAGIGISLSRLRKLRDQFEKRLKAAAGKLPWRPAARPTRLREIAKFGSNPGNLRMHAYVPNGVGPSVPLVVALHGCTQTADSYDRGTGWSDLQERIGHHSRNEPPGRTKLPRFPNQVAGDEAGDHVTGDRHQANDGIKA